MKSLSGIVFQLLMITAITATLREIQFFTKLYENDIPRAVFMKLIDRRMKTINEFKETSNLTEIETDYCDSILQSLQLLQNLTDESDGMQNCAKNETFTFYENIVNSITFSFGRRRTTVEYQSPASISKLVESEEKLNDFHRSLVTTLIDSYIDDIKMVMESLNVMDGVKHEINNQTERMAVMMVDHLGSISKNIKNLTTLDEVDNVSKKPIASGYFKFALQQLDFIVKKFQTQFKCSH
ncbi:uncharacterized protein LOC107361442 [Tetranychus urticae]|uniref:Uncharacterized protein n=1 Tax=Tetranychus urticae TaxID=32264 RepID=T1K6W9_TETUR|nr:uncharacterized protein LOC107361442 [Tetranychus urticae]